MDAVTEANRRAWEMASHKHVREYDDPLAQAAAGSSLNAVERGLLAGILADAPEVVHLQSGHGLDDAALVQAGAKSVIGVDYSAVAAGAAQRRADELGLACRYIVSTVPGVPLADGTADLLYTGKGALIWMPDIDAWAREAIRLLRPGGHLFVYEGHPAVPLWTWDEGRPGIRDDRSYFAGFPRQRILPGPGSHRMAVDPRSSPRSPPLLPPQRTHSCPGRRPRPPGKAVQSDHRRVPWRDHGVAVPNTFPADGSAGFRPSKPA